MFAISKGSLRLLLDDCGSCVNPRISLRGSVFVDSSNARRESRQYSKTLHQCFITENTRMYMASDYPLIARA